MNTEVSQRPGDGSHGCFCFFVFVFVFSPQEEASNASEVKLLSVLSASFKRFALSL